MGLNFRIVENSPVIHEELIEPFKKDYFNGLTYKELGKKYDISECKIRRVIDELDLPLRERIPKYYHYKSDANKYGVLKRRNNKQICNITCDTEEEAQEIVQYLVKHNWSEESINKVRKKKEYKNYYYNKNWGKYVVSKMLNGKRLFTSGFDSECEAQEVVKYLKSNNWSKEALKKYIRDEK